VPFSPKPTEHLVAVAVPVPGLGVLTYRVTGRTEAPPKGARVQVPLGTRTMTGCVVGPADKAASPTTAAVKDVVSVVDEEAFLPPAVVDLALWMGEYYAAGPGDTLVSAMPPAARRAETRPFRMRQIVELTATAGAVRRAIRGRRQQQALELVASRPAGVPVSELGHAGISPATVRRLARLGAVCVRDEIDERDPFGGETGRRGDWSLDASGPTSLDLTDEQTVALDLLCERADERRFHVALLQGVTGSGKTEVYLRLAEHVIRRGGRVLVLVPEIALTPALVGQFRGRAGSRVAVQHSGLSQGERHDQWHRIRRGDVDIVIGTRSAIVAPIDRLALIVVDEEHEPSYKQEETPRYHARDVAVVRGQMERALVVLGSATPSLESAANALSGRYERIELSRRVLGRPMANVRIVDMRREMAGAGRLVTFSAALLDAIAERLKRGEQSLVLLNRRGYATVVFCRRCGRSIECPHCSVYLTFHKAVRRLRCHYCNHAAPVPKQCEECGGEYLEHSGFGTERLESDLRQIFASARIGRLDRDTARRRGAIARLLAAVAGRELDIVVGTQMIAKGHDFPGVTLVGVVSADVGLGMADFRASERTFQLLTQVVGRAGRGDVAGEAIVQTLYPDHYSVRAAARQDYQAFFTREMEFRTAMHYPPDTALINVVVKSRSLESAMEDAADLVRRVRTAATGRVIGPAPAALARVRGEYRAQFFVKGTRRRAMREAVLAALAARTDLRKRTTVDVDPVTVT
jgi:primosomal protein N' (replication factor Y)